MTLSLSTAQQTEPCGGCGETDPSKVCLGCLHSFRPTGSAAMTKDVSVSEALTAYELQVLIGTSISGRSMSPDQVFDLPAAWARLHGMGLIDRTDGLAIATKAGRELIATALRSNLKEQPVAPEGWVLVPRERDAIIGRAVTFTKTKATGTS